MKIKRSMLTRTAIAFSLAMAVLSCTHSPQVITPEVSFSSDILPILEADCAINGSCHLGANNGNDQISLDTAVAYTTIAAKHLVAGGDPAASVLYSQVSNGIMPKSPYPVLDAAKIALIYNWIKQGAKNN